MVIVMTFAWIVFDGMTVNPSIGNSANSNTLIVKSYVGAEVQPAMVSPWTPLSTMGPEPDLAAMEEIQKLFYSMADGFPAKMNFLGGVASLIAGGLKTVGKGVLTELMKPEKKENKPKPKEKAKAEIEEAEELLKDADRAVSNTRSQSRGSSRRRSTSRGRRGWGRGQGRRGRGRGGRGRGFRRQRANSTKPSGVRFKEDTRG